MKESNLQTATNTPAPATRHERPRIEKLEGRRLMSGAMETTVHPSSDAASRDAYEFELGRPGESFQPLSAFAAAAYASPSLGPTVQVTGAVKDLMVAEFLQPGSDPDVITATYSPRIRIWGPNATSTSAFDTAMPDLQKGTERAVRLPAKPEPTQPTEPLNGSGAHTALVVEDDALTRASLMAVLRRRGWQVTGVGTLADAEAEIQARPEVVILDLTLPDGPGEALLEHIRSAHLPTTVAVTTGVHDIERMRHVEELHPDVVLAKPINLAALLHSLPHDGMAAAA